jgi:hypothetical protein
MLRTYALSPHDRMAMASVLWDPLGQRAAADSVATAVLSEPDTPAVDAQSVLAARERLLGPSAGTDAVSAWLHGRLGERGGARE